MSERRQQEIELLRLKFPKLQHDPGFTWVMLQGFPLPKGRFNRDVTTVLFMLPTGYPVTGPDNFAVEAELRIADGSMPPAFNLGNTTSSWTVPVPGAWGWFSWHPQNWRPQATIEGGDNLIGYISSISLCLRGEESA